MVYIHTVYTVFEKVIYGSGHLYLFVIYSKFYINFLQKYGIRYTPCICMVLAKPTQIFLCTGNHMLLSVACCMLLALDPCHDFCIVHCP